MVLAEFIQIEPSAFERVGAYAIVGLIGGVLVVGLLEVVLRGLGLWRDPMDPKRAAMPLPYVYLVLLLASAFFFYTLLNTRQFVSVETSGSTVMLNFPFPGGAEVVPGGSIRKVRVVHRPQSPSSAPRRGRVGEAWWIEVSLQDGTARRSFDTMRATAQDGAALIAKTCGVEVEHVESKDAN